MYMRYYFTICAKVMMAEEGKFKNGAYFELDHDCFQ